MKYAPPPLKEMSWVRPTFTKLKEGNRLQPTPTPSEAGNNIMPAGSRFNENTGGHQARTLGKRVCRPKPFQRPILKQKANTD